MDKVSIICFSNIDWSFVRQRHQHLMTQLGRLDWVEHVIFVETIGVRKLNHTSGKDWSRIRKKIPSYLKALARPLQHVESNVYTLTPLAFPFWHSFVHLINKTLLEFYIWRAKRMLRSSRIIFWVYLPHPVVLEYVKEHDKLMSIYDCADEISAFQNVQPVVVLTEQQLIQYVDVVFATSERLVSKVKATRNDVVLLPNAVGAQFIIEPNSIEITNEKVVLGYVGVIREWFDLELMYKVANEFKDYSIVIAGPSEVDLTVLQSLPNVTLLGRREYHELPTLISSFRVCLIPFKLNELTLATNPVKIYEYFALGKAVVSTPLPEIMSFDKYLYVGKDSGSFIDGIRLAVAEDDPHLKEERKMLAGQNTWEARAQKVGEYLTTLSEKGDTGTL